MDVTARAVVIGVVLGTVLAVVNTYVGLKTGVVESGNFVAVLVGYVLCRAHARAGGPAVDPLELVTVQTIALGAGGMVNVIGLSGAMSGLAMFGHAWEWPALTALGVATAALALVGVAAMRRELLERAPLPFPTGQATAALIRSVTGRGGGDDDQPGARDVRPMVAAAVLSGALAWFRDARPAWIPQTFGLPATSVRIAVSPLLVGVGAMVGARIALAIAAGSLLAWSLLGPWLVERGTIGPDPRAMGGWLLWPGVALVLGGSLAALIRERAAMRGGGGRFTSMMPRRALAAAGAAALAACTVATLLEAPLAAIAIALAAAPVLAWIGARVAGESDVGLGGPLGAVAQFAIAPAAATAPGVLVPTSIASGVVALTARSMWALKAAAVLGAPPGRQIACLALGALVGAVVAPIVFELLLATHRLGGPDLPAPFAQTFAASTRALLEGTRAVPAGALTAAAIAFALGVGLMLAAGPGWRRFVPSPTALGIGCLLPLAYALPIGAGGLLALAAVRAGVRPATVSAAAVGTLIGEALLGTLIAALRIGGTI